MREGTLRLRPRAARGPGPTPRKKEAPHTEETNENPPGPEALGVEG